MRERVTRVTCEWCGEVIVAELDTDEAAEDWYLVTTDGDETADFCSLHCLNMKLA